MKHAFALVLTLLCACSGQINVGSDIEQTEPFPAPEDHHGISQPFTLVDVGDYLHDGLVAIRRLPNGWVVASRDGHIFALNEEFHLIGYDAITTETYGPSGLASIIVNPDFENNGLIYAYHQVSGDGPPCDSVYCTALDVFRLDLAQTQIVQDLKTLILFEMSNRSGLHQGGAMEFGPDGMLYLALGDSQRNEEWEGSPAQDMGTHLGKLHRIDLDTLQDDIVATGLRNPFTGASTDDGIFLGDVGRDTFEEINFFPWNGGSLNYGWPLEEGAGINFTGPVGGFPHCDEEFEDQDPFGHDEAKDLSVKNHAGVVHPCGNEIISVAGTWGDSIVYSDPYYGFVRAFEFENGKVKNDRHIAHFPGINSCAEDDEGLLYCISIFASGNVLKMIAVEE